ncbi:hypothetical protein A8924_6583 [Saccharopolyspora erythraea NRRL 2338]|uniref:Uncharacterized protein n=2 Tax=Saccharopolyspora erythraea TaxID=1836 RepID=A4FMY3_SACEN|nr:hypothetical protein [Saccharopolyspora erythraea]EQD84921.1 hypothetical protein N599_17590 [Saccharopolyspora erythraea D]PFG99050.1 hypothetical protein A8924_6583 [Saccharopolyspora erythraea NRRL 2338]QRK89015.1 hypothetical protein JQX30_31230 [Saccharopolyspora erythraea]CAM05408.1 hypothetical protein SACE_6235 [Saccharopolyspora erythraea NRRL 2338]
MKWLPGGWQRADSANDARKTVPRGEVGDRGTARYTSEQSARGEDRTVRAQPPHSAPPPGRAVPVVLGADAQDVDVSASSFRTLLIGGGISGLLTVLCAATLANKGSTVGMWIWQLVFGVIFLWFATSSRGMLSSRGFLFDRGGFYARTRGEVVGVSWDEIAAVGVGTLPWIQHNRPVPPDRRVALEFYPADAGFAARHPEFDRWRIEEPPSMPGLPGERYRFHLPPFSKLARSVEHAVQTVAPRKWVGHYKRELPAPTAT